MGGAIYNDGGHVAISDGCSIASNSASSGGGIYESGGTVTITGSTLLNNHANEAAGAFTFFRLIDDLWERHSSATRPTMAAASTIRAR